MSILCSNNICAFNIVSPFNIIGFFYGLKVPKLYTIIFVKKILKRNARSVISSKEACVAERLKPRTSDLKVRGLSPTRRVVSSDKKLYSILPLHPDV